MRRTLFWLGGVVFTLVFSGLGLLLPIVHAQDESAISLGFLADTSIADGALVSFKQDQADSVQPATRESAQRLAGVAATETLVTLNEEEGKTQVIISGTALVLVSDINGDVKTGDKITISPIEGVGMRATDSGQVVGTAQADFSEISSQTQMVKDRAGEEQTVRIGRLPVQVNIAYYAAPTSQLLPPFIQNIADSVAGKPVSLVRVLLAASVLLVGATSIFVLLYSSTRSGIASIGRNPLAAGAIRKGLLQIGVYAVLILAFSLLAAYLILAL